MLNSLFSGIFDDGTQTVLSLTAFLCALATGLFIGIFLVIIYTYKSKYTKSFVITLATLPAIVAVIIMMVNGNIGAGVAVTGAFSLVRFRSVPGSAKEIGTIFLAMGAGLIVGMGYIGYALLFSLILGAITLFYQKIGLGDSTTIGKDKTMRISIPDDLDYTNIFDDLMDKYTSFSEVISVKTTNLGSLFRLTYNVTLKDSSLEKEFIDALRCRNGNLEISVSMQEVNSNEL